MRLAKQCHLAPKIQPLREGMRFWMACVMCTEYRHARIYHHVRRRSYSLKISGEICRHWHTKPLTIDQRKYAVRGFEFPTEMSTGKKEGSLRKRSSTCTFSHFVCCCTVRLSCVCFFFVGWVVLRRDIYIYKWKIKFSRTKSETSHLGDVRRLRKWGALEDNIHMCVRIYTHTRN